jgi:hypothetical protein
MMPPASRIGDTVRETASLRPSFACLTVSKWSILSPRMRRESTMSSSPRSSSGTMR